MKTQREAVYEAVVDVIGEVDGKVELTRDQRKDVQERLIHGFVNGEISYRGECTEEQARKYVPGLLSNWLRKDTRLNGGEKYVPKNPGIRAGNGDEQLKAMRALLAATKDPGARAEIEAEIEKRKAELRPKPSINVEALPEHLRHLVPENNEA